MALDAHDDGLMSVNGLSINLRMEQTESQTGFTNQTPEAVRNGQGLVKSYKIITSELTPVELLVRKIKICLLCRSLFKCLFVMP